jgi:dTDP-L-rhamnose 4-epimerase
MRALVTGGAGFIGSHVVDALVDRGWEVSVLDALDPRAHAGPPGYLNEAARYHWGSLLDPEAIRRALEGADAVAHQAAMVGLGTDLGDLDDYARNNDLGTAVLLRVLHESGFRGRLVLASSMVVYGEGRYRCERDGPVRPLPRSEGDLAAGRFEPRCPRCGRSLQPEPVPEEAPLDPRSVYAATKVHQEHLCGAWAREEGTELVALRYHNVYGPRMPRDTPYAGVASLFRSALAAGRDPEVFEDGGQRRDFVHVRDVATANVLAMEADGEVTGAFNVGSGEPHTIREMADALCRAFGGRHRPRISGAYRLGDVRHVFASTERAASILGFRPAVGFEDGIHGFASAPLRDSADAGAPDDPALSR